MDSLVSRAPKLRVLVVDDDAGMRDLLIDELSDQRIDVIEVKNGHDALRQIRFARPDLVLTDLAMPAGGFDYLKKLRVLAPNVPIIVLTSFGDPRAKETMGECGVDVYLDKPVRIQSIRAAISELLDHRHPSIGAVR